VAKHFGSPRHAWRDLPKRCSTPSSTAPAATPIAFVYDDGLRTYKTTKPFEGVIGNLERRYKETESAGMREEIENYMSQAPCLACNGYRLKPEALAVKIAGLHIGQVSTSRSGRRRSGSAPCPKLTAQAARDRRAHPQGDPRAAGLPQRCRPRLPDAARNSGTLSGGESQRIRLASQIGSGLTGVLYVLDEPSIGLHQRDNERLLETLRACATSATR
jgi:excinuclease ABC subunit A